MTLLAAGALACLLVTGVAGQAAAQDTGSGQSGGGLQTGSTPPLIHPGRAAAGQSQSRHGTTNSRSSGSSKRSSQRAESSSVPAANGQVEIIGYGGNIKSGTLSKPLLPIASLGNQAGIASGTAIRVRFSKAIDSGHVRNGDVLDATLAQPVASFPADAAVQLTVVQASRAGALLSCGELSLQVISIGGKAVLSDTISAQGKEGKKEQADAAPAIGTEAGFSAGEVITLPAA